MTGFIPGTLWSNETLICEVNVFLSEETSELVTLVSKTNQKVLLFQPNEALTLHYQKGTRLHQDNLVFHEVKMLNRKPYYVFRVIPQTQSSLKIEPFSALFSNETENGIFSVIQLERDTITVLYDKPIQGRYFEITFKENNQLRHFFGKMIWAKKEDSQHVYQLLSI